MVFDVSKYKKIFLSDAREDLKTLNDSLLKLEKTPENLQPAEELMRAAHTLKSTAASMEYLQISELAHAMEDVFDARRAKKIQLNPKLIDLSFKCFDTLEVLLDRIAKDKGEIDTAPLIKKLKLALSRAEKIASKESGTGEVSDPEGIELAKKSSIIQPIESIKVSTERLDTLMNLAEELLVSKMRLARIPITKNYEDIPPAVDALDRLVSDLQYNVMQARLVPVGEIFNRFPRMVRDLAQKAKKKINFVIEGSDIELDRTIIDQIGEPLVHLLRNAVDHGIEKKGTIKLAAIRERGYASVSVQDDGRGLDLKRIKEAAVRRGIITALKAKDLSQEEITELIYHPHLSVSKTVTRVSGRGVGLNVVRTKVETLGGKVLLASEPNKGCKFTMEFPLTLAIISALLAKVEDEVYAIPLSDVERLVRVEKDQIKSFLDQEVAVVERKDIPLLRLTKLFNIEAHEGLAPKRSEMAVLVKKGQALAGLVVDSIISEQEIIVKPLGKFLRVTKGFAGVTILGDGRAVLILDITSLI